MTKAELIKSLNSYPDHYEVRISHPNGDIQITEDMIGLENFRPIVYISIPYDEE